MLSGPRKRTSDVRVNEYTPSTWLPAFDLFQRPGCQLLTLVV
jgi:hypothetical protein